MPTRTLEMTDEAAMILDRLLATTRFESESEAVSLAVLLLEENEASMDALVARAVEGYEPAERGEFVEGTAQEVLERSFAQALERWEARQREAGMGADDAA